jgi:hypothetical protein
VLFIHAHAEQFRVGESLQRFLDVGKVYRDGLAVEGGLVCVATFVVRCEVALG